MTSTSSSAATRRFYPLEQADFLKLEQAASLKGLLQPFKGKGALTQWASQCHRLRDELIELAQRRVLAQANAYPFRLLPVEGRVPVPEAHLTVRARDGIWLAVTPR